MYVSRYKDFFQLCEYLEDNFWLIKICKPALNNINNNLLNKLTDPNICR